MYCIFISLIHQINSYKFSKKIYSLWEDIFREDEDYDVSPLTQDDLFIFMTLGIKCLFIISRKINLLFWKKEGMLLIRLSFFS